MSSARTPRPSHTAVFAMALLFLSTGVAGADTLSMKCSFNAVDGKLPFDILYVMNNAVYGKMTVIGVFGTREATSFLNDDILFVLESAPDTAATSMIYLKPNEEIVALRSSVAVMPRAEIPADRSNILTLALRGTCAMQR